MAITDKELEISNKSYINKDFESIYTELLDLAKKISYKYDPQSSNESDPFIVLLKLLAFVGDKTNYNIDKNILERFMPSATQDKSMRDLTEMLGYNMHYYVGAEGEVNITYEANNDDSITNTSQIFIPRFTVIENSTNDIQYVTKEPTSLTSTNNWSSNVDVIQGSKKDLTVLDSAVIKLENIENNKLYLPEVSIAENGIFIKTDSYDYDEWEKVDNLNYQTYGSRKYRISYDSRKGLPYIEFPSWLDVIIENGLSISYIITDGAEGNVKANALTNITVSKDVESYYYTDFEDDNFIVSNVNATNTGADKQDIDSAYEGFKKTIGTFETLVTCRDYANYIYKNMYDNEGIYPLVSNVLVSDRRTDINYNTQIITYTSEQNTKTISVNDSSEITPYDLCIYAFNPIKDYDFSSLNECKSYNKSFKLLTDVEGTIFNRLENSNSISHNFKDVKQPNNILALKNYYTISAAITTTYKVSSNEQVSILNNINEALAKDYNCRNVNFGYEIPFDSILKTIEEADSRIKRVNLYPFELNTKIYYMNAAGDEKEESIIGNTGDIQSNYFNAVICKNILSGRISMFDYDEDFNYKWGQTDGTKIENINKISTYFNVPELNKDLTEYTLNENEIIQFVRPNLINEVNYTAGIKYTLSNIESIDKNSYFELTGDQKITFEWVDSNNETKTESYTAASTYQGVTGYIFKFNFSNAIKYDVQKIISSGDQVEVYRINTEKITKSTNFYWHLNNNDNKLEWIEHKTIDKDTQEKVIDYYSYILKDNEYIYYTDINYKSLYDYSSGTELKITPKVFKKLSNWICDKITDLTSLDEYGLSAFKNNFKGINLSTNTDDYFQITQQQILTLVEGNKLKLVTTDSSLQINPNEFKDLSDVELKYTIDSEEKTIKNDNALLTWKVRSILDLNVGPEITQELTSNQKVIIYYTENEQEKSEEIYSNEGESNTLFNLNYLYQIEGGEDIVLSYLGNDLTEKHPSIYYYKNQDNISDILSDLSENKYLITWNDDSTTKSRTINIPYISLKEDEEILFMLYSLGVEDAALNFNIQANKCDLTKYFYSSETSYKSGLTIYKLSNIEKGATLTFEYTEVSSEDKDSIQIILDNIKIIKGINSLIGTSIDESELITKLKEVAGRKNNSKSDEDDNLRDFYCTADLDNSKVIGLNSNYNLLNPYILYNSNNFVNNWVLNEIDFATSDIYIERNSCK